MDGRAPEMTTIYDKLSSSDLETLLRSRVDSLRMSCSAAITQECDPTIYQDIADISLLLKARLAEVALPDVKGRVRSARTALD